MSSERDRKNPVVGLLVCTCGKTMKVRRSTVGRSGRCKGCGDVLHADIAHLKPLGAGTDPTMRHAETAHFAGEDPSDPADSLPPADYEAATVESSPGGQWSPETDAWSEPGEKDWRDHQEVDDSGDAAPEPRQGSTPPTSIAPRPPLPGAGDATAWDGVAPTPPGGAPAPEPLGHVTAPPTTVPPADPPGAWDDSLGDTTGGRRAEADSMADWFNQSDEYEAPHEDPIERRRRSTRHHSHPPPRPPSGPVTAPPPGATPPAAARAAGPPRWTTLVSFMSGGVCLALAGMFAGSDAMLLAGVAALAGLGSLIWALARVIGARRGAA